MEINSNLAFHSLDDVLQASAILEGGLSARHFWQSLAPRDVQSQQTSFFSWIKESLLSIGQKNYGNLSDCEHAWKMITRKKWLL